MLKAIGSEIHQGNYVFVFYMLGFENLVMTVELFEIGPLA